MNVSWMKIAAAPHSVSSKRVEGFCVFEVSSALWHCGEEEEHENTTFLCRCTRVVRRKNQSSSRCQFSLQWQVRNKGSSPFLHCQFFCFFPFLGVVLWSRAFILALDLWRTFWLSTVSLVCSSSLSESDPCSCYEATVSLLDTNENEGEIWEVKHSLLLFLRIRVRVRVSLTWAFKLQKRNTKQARNAGSSTLFSGIVLWFSKLACGFGVCLEFVQLHGVTWRALGTPCSIPFYSLS
jgi:hypothetical protein